MNFAETDEVTLALTVLANMGEAVDYGNIPVNGAAKAAEYML